MLQRRAAWPTLWAAAPEPVWRADVERAHRPPNCAGSRAALPPRPRSRRWRFLADRARHSLPMQQGAAVRSDQQPAMLISTAPSSSASSSTTLRRQDRRCVRSPGQPPHATSIPRHKASHATLGASWHICQTRGMPIDQEIADSRPSDRAISPRRRLNRAGISTESGFPISAARRV